jgi:hypothetical protein
MIGLMIALRKLKDLENVWLFDRMLVRMDFDFRLMNCRYSGEERPLSQKAAGLYTFQHWGCIMGVELRKHFLDALQTSG